MLMNRKERRRPLLCSSITLVALTGHTAEQAPDADKADPRIAKVLSPSSASATGIANSQRLSRLRFHGNGWPRRLRHALIACLGVVLLPVFGVVHPPVALASPALAG